jgi:glycosyltransferase involved in cell wall biosynthesis
MSDGLLSIIMVNYNHGLYLEQAIESVLSQTYKNWELLIIDDGSKDNSLEIIKRYVQRFPEKIKLATHPQGENQGISNSYRLGLNLCCGEFIGFLEPDDIWLASNAETKINQLRKQDIGLVYSGLELLGDPEVIKRRRPSIESFFAAAPTAPFAAFGSLCTANFIPSFSLAIVRREALNGLKFLSDKKYAVWLDWFLWLQASLKSKLRPLKKPFFNGRNPEERRQSRRGISFRYEAIRVKQRFCNALKFLFIPQRLAD